MTRTLGIRESTNGLGALILVRGQEIVQAFMPERLEEPFATSWSEEFARLEKIRYGWLQRVLLTCTDQAVL